MSRDIEIHILNQTKKLSDGTYDKIFTRNPKNESGLYTYNCHLCSVANLPGEVALHTHIAGKKHQQRLMYDFTPDAKAFRAPLAIHPKIPIPIPYAAFEPRPPGLEEETTPAIYFDHYSAKTDKPLIGLEYLVELIDPKMKEPLYVCTLCDKRCDPRNILPQVTSHRHRMKYLDFHFSSVMTFLNKDHEFNVNMAYREEVLSKIAQHLQDKFGRQKPSVFEYRDYERNKNQINEKIKNGKHFSEKDFPECEKILLKNIKIREFDDISSEDDEDAHYKEKTNSLSSRRYGETITSSNINFNHAREFSAKVNISVPSTSASSRPFPTSKELSAQAEKKFKDSYTFEKYRISVEVETQRLDQKYKDFEKNPEKHPDYSDEWKSFWQRRYNELLAKGQDANGHNYKPEWIKFWMPRMKQLKLKEMEKKKIEVTKRLNITKEMAQDFDNEILRKKISSPKRERSPSPRRERTRRSRSPIEISDEESDDNRSSNDRHKRLRRTRSNSRSRSRYSETPERNRRERRSSSPEINDDGPINIVTVCRLLLALETELGIIAPRVVSLLEKALALERASANSSEELLRDLKNINFLDTVKEKLKGLLSTDLLQQSRITPVKKAIRNIAALLHEASKLKPTTAPSTSAAVKEIVQPDPTELAKLEIAKVLAQTLIDQGKTDVSAEELSQIVDEFMQSQLSAMEQDNEEPKPSTSNSTQPQQQRAVEEPKNEENSLENLTDEDLKTLLRNFSDLTEDEQKHLIRYLEKLEKSDPRRVKMLSKYVDAGEEEIDDEDASNDVEMAVERSNHSPPRVAQNLSDDEYDDDEPRLVNIVPRPAAPKPSSSTSSSAAASGNISNSHRLATELMNSLMQSQQAPPPLPQWGWDASAENYYAQNQPTFNPQVGYQQPIAAMSVMATPIQQNYWPGHASAGSFHPLEAAFASRQIPPSAPRTKKLERPNNTQLTGKGKNRKQ